MTSCPFCRIAADPAGASALLDSPLAVAFLDIRPMRPGHALVIPKRHEPDFWRLSAEEHDAVWALAKQLAAAQEQLFGPSRVGLLVAGFDVPHAHLHVLPFHENADLKLGADAGQPTAPEVLAEHRQRYAKHFAPRHAS